MMAMMTDEVFGEINQRYDTSEAVPRILLIEVALTEAGLVLLVVHVGLNGEAH